MIHDFGINSEYKTIGSILLHKPTVDVEDCNNPQEVCYKNKIDYSVIKREYAGIIGSFESLNINVSFVDFEAVDEDKAYLYNLMFTRDTLFMTPKGAVISRMAHKIRKGETKYIAQTLDRLGIPIIKTIDSPATFEGADALWLNEKLVLVGIGNRTNDEGYRQIKECLKEQDVGCCEVSVPQGIQHLLGVIQFIDKDAALVRVNLVEQKIVDALRENHINIIAVYENDEVAHRQAMNIVTIGPRNIVMASGCPETKALYLENGLTVASEVDISQLINGDGGLACATQILSREL